MGAHVAQVGAAIAFSKRTCGLCLGARSNLWDTGAAGARSRLWDAGDAGARSNLWDASRILKAVRGVCQAMELYYFDYVAKGR